MATFVSWLNDVMTSRFGMSESLADLMDESIAVIGLVGICILINMTLQRVFRFRNSVLSKRNLGHNLLLLVPGILFYLLVWVAFGKGLPLVRMLHKIDLVYIIIIAIMICNSILLTFLDYYNKSDKHKSRPLKGLVQGLQVLLIFIGGIIIIAVLIDKSPAALLTGLGASAAVLMLIFKDSILGFVAGVQLSQNNMIRLGDWIQMPDGSANGTVEEITLNTVKVRNWDNTLTMIPPYTLISAPFKNWRGMMESGGRRADKCIMMDVNSLEICSEDLIADIRKAFPIINNYMKTQHIGEDEDEVQKKTPDTTNVQLYRAYIEEYLRNHPEVNPALDIIITQKEATAYGLPIEVYFFLRDKNWASFERKQSDIFDHLIAVAPEFGLRLYQRP